MEKFYYREGEVFVFGSNKAGRHGLGAALTAKEYYGAKQGKGSGLSGNSYAIPTKDKDLNVLPLTEIKGYVDVFYQFCLDNPDRDFYVTPIGTGLAGYSDADIAPMFVKFVTLKNVRLHPRWLVLYDN